VFLRSDDALDIFALAAVLSLAAILLGADGAWLPVVGILVVRVAFWTHRAWWTERAARRVQTTLARLEAGSAAASADAPEDEEDEAGLEASSGLHR
jgi:Na+/glutamate symporter